MFIARTLLVVTAVFMLAAAKKNKAAPPPPRKAPRQSAPAYVPAPAAPMDESTPVPEFTPMMGVATKPTPAPTPTPIRRQRVGVEMTVHAIQLAKVEATGLAPGYVLQNPTDEIIPAFRIEDVSRFALTYGYGISKFNLGIQFLIFMGGPQELSWSEFRAHGYFNPAKNLVGFYVGPEVGMGTLRIESKSVGSSLYAGIDSGFKFEIKRGFDVGLGLDLGYMSCDYTRVGLATKAHWYEMAIRLLLGFAF